MDVLKPYGHIRGFNYVPSTACHDIGFWRDYDPQLVERELDYAQRLGLNSARVFLSYVVYEHDRDAFLQRVKHFVRAAHQRGISVMPVIWDSCFDETEPTYETQANQWIPNPGVQRLGPDFWPLGEHYCRDLVETLDDEPGILMWDVMNEPTITSWVRRETPERATRLDTIWTFVRHFCSVMKELKVRHPITVGVAFAGELPNVGASVDVLSFHDYSSTRAGIRERIQQGLGFANEFQKPILISELACLARANPYDVTLEICQSMHMGWYLWELMIGSSIWRGIHGVVYPDGTVRDPSIATAVLGFFRKRSGEIVPPDVDQEGAATRVCQAADTWLENTSSAYATGLTIAEELANLLEAGELVPLYDLPSVRIGQLAEESPEHRAELARLIALWRQQITPHLKRKGVPAPVNVMHPVE